MVPEGWQSGKIGDLCSLQNGRGFKPEEWDKAGLPIIRIQNLNGNQSFNYFSGEPLDKWLVQPGQMLFAWAGTKGVSFGPFIWQGPVGVLNQHIFKVFPKKMAYAPWLFLALRQLTDVIETRAHGFKATLVHVKKGEIENSQILIPPLPEQKKIAEILSTWDRAIEVAERQLENARLQKKALMQQLLTGTRRLPGFDGEWKTVKLGDVANIERGKFSARPRNDPRFFQGGTHPFVQTGDVTNSQVYLRSASQTLNEAGLGVSKVFPVGTVLMTIAANIGEVALTTFPVACPDSIVGISPLPNEILAYWLHQRLEIEKENLDRLAPKLAQKNINLETLKPLSIKVPTLEEQHFISDILSSLDHLIELALGKLTHLRTEKRALMQQLLTGKKRVTV
ncbi:restriction endonuclease subunit S [uncultured Cohaesibacter sp.]|uniref:restriction endonuclease subunit S n=1 Tax=uncultured Cohaesibacter sp. TaxID=1002546 RepID=UPI002AAB31AB|nr:restriction endonuclease subunit S [uncultured Cohaesibacter sp.]